MESQTNITERRMSTIATPPWLEKNQRNTNERRMSSMFPPPWLQKNKNVLANLSINSPDSANAFDRPRMERASGYDSSDEGLPRKKIPASNECNFLINYLFIYLFILFK